PVTEAITGLDLVEWQLRIAQGQPLPLQQQQVALNGHAIEVRLYAEDPDNDFLPASGTLALYREPPVREGCRMDSGVSQGDSVSPFYDPMLAKLIVWGETREAARLKLLQMLEQTRVAGIQTNQAFLQRILALPAFAEGQIDTGFIPRYQQQLLRNAPELDKHFWHLAAQAWLAGRKRTNGDSPWTRLTPGWRAGMPGNCRLHLRCGEQHQQLDVQYDASCQFDDSCQFDCQFDAGAEQLLIELDGVRQRIPVAWHDQAMLLYWQQQWLRIEAVDPLSSHQGHADSGGLQAPMNGSIVSLQVQVGDQVAAGSVLLVLEAMKMEHSIRAPQAGTVTALFCREGELVAEGTLLVELEDMA
ncbi:MAG: biotin/lipoyl-containing protein, partial [Pseudomonas sp.]